VLAILLAAGFFYPDIGSLPMGRGGTGAAGAGDLSAMEMNPAGLASLRGFTLQGEISSTWQPIDFTRANTCGGTPCAAVSQSSGAFPNTVSGLSWEVRDGLVVALGVYGPPSHGRENFPDPRVVKPILTQAPQRYSLISEDNLVVYPGVGVGWRALDWLDVGAVLQLRYFRANQVQSLYSLDNQKGEDPTFDAIATVDATEALRPVFGLGAIARPLPGLSVGLSLRPSAPVHASGTIDVTLPSFAVAAGATVTGSHGNVDLMQPPVARLGVRYDAARWSAMADLVWENWGVLRTITVTPTDVVLQQGGTNFSVPPISLPRDWHASWSPRVGGEFVALDWLTLRAGALYESGAIPDETLQIDFASLPRFAGTLGATARWRSLTFTASWAHYFQQERTISDSEAIRVDPYPAPAFVVGNGRYSTSLDVVAFQISWLPFSRR